MSGGWKILRRGKTELTETSFLETVSLRLEMIMDVIVVRALGRVGREEREEVYWLS